MRFCFDDDDFYGDGIGIKFYSKILMVRMATMLLIRMIEKVTIMTEMVMMMMTMVMASV